jgi:hypothetical protein
MYSRQGRRRTQNSTRRNAEKCQSSRGDKPLIIDLLTTIVACHEDLGDFKGYERLGQNGWPKRLLKGTRRHPSLGIVKQKIVRDCLLIFENRRQGLETNDLRDRL